MAKEKVLILYLDWFRTDPVLDGKFPFLARAIHAHRGLWAIRSISWDDGFFTEMDEYNTKDSPRWEERSR